MTPADQFIKFLGDFIFNFNIWRLVKALFVIGFGIYIAFSVIVVRQVGLMAKTVQTNFNLPLKLMAWVHLGAAILVFLLALLML